MNATMVATGTKAVPPVVSSIQDIPLAKIRESKTNPRRLFDEAKLAELADFVPGNKMPRYVAKAVMWHSDPRPHQQNRRRSFPGGSSRWNQAQPWNSHSR